MRPRADEKTWRNSSAAVSSHVCGSRSGRANNMRSVVSTWTLCSIPDAGRALGEIRRVLRPGGRFVFLEHGLSDEARVQRWQWRLKPIQRLLADGCRLDLDVEAVVRGQPFQAVKVDRFVLERTPRTHGTLYRGVAMK